MRFKKIYVEITNCCNFNCSFCFHSDRKKQFVSPEVFSAILFHIRPYTEYLYLHVLGEPLLHPNFSQLLQIAFDMGFHVNITTNGSLLSKVNDFDIINMVRQFNVSMHDAAENVPAEKLDGYLYSVANFASSHADNAYFSLRLWNQGVDSVSDFNKHCLSFLSDYFKVTLPEDVLSHRNTMLAPHIFLQNSARFSWPGTLDEGYVDNHSCQALRDHIAVLVDGTIVPCCLDAGANLALGNILTDSLEDVLKSPRALSIQSGFQHHKAVESICQHCGFFLAK